MNCESIVVGGGCFWCLEAVFLEVDGVVEVESGYAGGSVANPDYDSVCSGRTGHAEVVRLVFDSDRLPLADLLAIFFAIHDPTTLDRQGHRRQPVSVDHPHGQRVSARHRAPGDRRARGERWIRRSARHRSRPARCVLPGRGRSPTLLRAAPGPGLLPRRDRSQAVGVPARVRRAPSSNVSRRPVGADPNPPPRGGGGFVVLLSSVRRRSSA